MTVEVEFELGKSKSIWNRIWELSINQLMGEKEEEEEKKNNLAGWRVCLVMLCFSILRLVLRFVFFPVCSMSTSKKQQPLEDQEQER